MDGWKDVCAARVIFNFPWDNCNRSRRKSNKVTCVLREVFLPFDQHHVSVFDAKSLPDVSIPMTAAPLAVAAADEATSLIPETFNLLFGKTTVNVDQI